MPSFESLATPEYMQKLADNLESYIDLIDRFLIVEGLTEKEYKDAMKTTKKLIKKLRKNNLDVFNRERFMEIYNNGRDIYMEGDN